MASRIDRLLSYSAKNMFYSLAAVLIIVFAAWAISPQPSIDQRRPPEIDKTASFAASEAAWPVWTPEGLDEGWSGTLVSYGQKVQTPTWRLLMVSPRTQSVQIRQAVDPNAEWLALSLTDVTDQGSTVSIAGPDGPAEWGIWTGVSENDENLVALVLEPTPEQPATTVVNGTADIQEMSTFIESLVVASSD